MESSSIASIEKGGDSDAKSFARAV